MRRSPYSVEVAPGDLRELRLDLRSPCNDCPFRSDVPCHEGVASSLPDMSWSLAGGDFRHTCHKTDPRSDSDEGKANLAGPVQHCAGAMIMAVRSGETTNLMDDAEARGVLRLRRLNFKAPVGTFIDMLKRYEPWVRAEVARKEQEDLLGSREGG